VCLRFVAKAAKHFAADGTERTQIAQMKAERAMVQTTGVAASSVDARINQSLSL
jgi:hypothetical protein